MKADANDVDGAVLVVVVVADDDDVAVVVDDDGDGDNVLIACFLTNNFRRNFDFDCLEI